MDRESIEEFFRKLGKSLEDLKDTLEEMICAADDPAEEIEEPTSPSHYTSDFACSCRYALRLDLIPWYTSGFK